MERRTFAATGSMRNFFLRADAAADQDELRIEDVHHARQPLRDLVRPAVDEIEHQRISCLGRRKDGPAIFQVGVNGVGSPHQSRGGGVLLPAAHRPAGAKQAVLGVGTVVAHLAAQAPGTLQQAAPGQDAAADASAQRDTDDVGIALCPADPDFTQAHAVGVVGHSDGPVEFGFQLLLDGAADVVGQVAAGAHHHAGMAVDLAGGGNADAFQRLRVFPPAR